MKYIHFMVSVIFSFVKINLKFRQFCLAQIIQGTSNEESSIFSIAHGLWLLTNDEWSLLKCQPISKVNKERLKNIAIISPSSYTDLRFFFIHKWTTFVGIGVVNDMGRRKKDISNVWDWSIKSVVFEHKYYIFLEYSKKTIPRKNVSPLKRCSKSSVAFGARVQFLQLKNLCANLKLWHPIFGWDSCISSLEFECFPYALHMSIHVCFIVI